MRIAYCMNESPLINHMHDDGIHYKTQQGAKRSPQNPSMRSAPLHRLNQFKTINTKLDGVSLKSAYIDKARQLSTLYLLRSTPTCDRLYYYNVTKTVGGGASD